MSSEKTPDRNIHNRFLIAGILGSIFSSITWISEQEAVMRISPLTATALGPLLGSLVLAPYALRYRNLPSPKEILDLWKPFAVVILWRNIIGSFLFISALVMTSSSKVMFLTKIEPYVVILLHWILYHEKVARKELILLLVHIAGAMLLSTGGAFSLSIEQLGDLLVFLGVLGNSLMYRPAKILADAWGSAIVSTLGGFISGVILLPFAILLCPQDFTTQAPKIVGYLYLFVSVILYYVLSSTLWFYSLRGLKPWLNSALRCVGPVVAAPIAWLLFQKPLTEPQICGAIIVILTSALLVHSAGSNSKEAPTNAHPETVGTP